MKKLFKLIDLFDIKLSTIFLLFLSSLVGYIKPFLMYFFIAFIHEFSHLVVCIFYKLNIRKFLIIPFGAKLEVDNIDNVNSSKQIIIYLAGPASYFINLIWINLFLKLNLINYVNYEFLSDANLIMCLLNLLPIFPLDGFIVIKAFLQLIFPYKNVLKISMLISLFSFVAFAIYNIYDFQPMVLFFLLFEQIKYFVFLKKSYKNFLIFKTMNKKEKKFKVINDYNMYKDANNYKIESQKVLNDSNIAQIELKNIKFK